MRAHLLLFLVLIPGLGCPSTPEEQDTIILDAGPDTEEDMPTPDMTNPDMSSDMTEPDMEEDHTYVPPKPCPDCAPITWEDGPALPSARDHHMTLIHEHEKGATLLVIGGLKAGAPHKFYQDMWVSTLSPKDGSMGPWRMGTPLPASLAGTPILINPKGYVILPSGRGETPQGQLYSPPSSLVGKLNPDGIEGNWETEDFPVSRFHHAGVYNQTHAYVTGGLELNDAMGTTHIGTFSDTGVESWREGPALPETRTHHVSFLHGNHVYIAGGFTGTLSNRPNLLTSVHRAPILANGDLGPWEENVSELPLALATGASVVRGDYVYLMGGIGGTGFSDVVLRAKLTDDGPEAWEELTDALIPRATGHTHHTPVYRDHVYLISGGRRNTLSDLSHHGVFHTP